MIRCKFYLLFWALAPGRAWFWLLNYLWKLCSKTLAKGGNAVRAGNLQLLNRLPSLIILCVLDGSFDKVCFINFRRDRLLLYFTLNQLWRLLCLQILHLLAIVILFLVLLLTCLLSILSIILFCFLLFSLLLFVLFLFCLLLAWLLLLRILPFRLYRLLFYLHSGNSFSLFFR